MRLFFRDLSELKGHFLPYFLGFGCMLSVMDEVKKKQ